jgi:hypothetical protein
MFDPLALLLTAFSQMSLGSAIFWCTIMLCVMSLLNRFIDLMVGLVNKALRLLHKGILMLHDALMGVDEEPEPMPVPRKRRAQAARSL